MERTRSFPVAEVRAGGVKGGGLQTEWLLPGPGTLMHDL